MITAGSSESCITIYVLLFILDNDNFSNLAPVKTNVYYTKSKIDW